MEVKEHRIAVQGVRALTAHLDQGTIQLSRVEGDELIVECSEGVVVERSDDTVVIRRGIGNPLEGKHGKHRIVVEKQIDDDDPPSVAGPEKGDLGAFISSVVNQAVGGLLGGDFFQGAAHSRVRVGVPAVLEMPRIEVHSSRGDLSLDGIQGRMILHSHMGDIQVVDAGGSLEARSGKGDITIQGFRGPVHAHSGMGDVELRECVGGGSAHTGSGDIEGRRLSGPWDMHTGSGDVSIEVDGSATFQITTGSGDIALSGGYLDRLEARTGSGDIQCTSILHGTAHNLTTGAGDIHLAIANPPGARLEAITRLGHISSEFPLVMVGKQGPQSRGGSRYVGKIGDGTIDIQLRSGAGDIAITRLAGERSSHAAHREEGPNTSSARDFPPSMPSTPPTPAFVPVPPTPPIPPIPAMTPVLSTAEPVPAVEVGDFPPDDQHPKTEERRPEPEATPATEHEGEQPAENPRLKVLESLQRGEITVEEASTLLRSLSMSA